MEKIEILKLLKSVKNPFTDVDIVSEGLVSKVSIEENKVVIYLAFARNTPPGPVSSALAWPLQAKIVRDIIDVFQRAGIGKFEILDDTTLQRYYPGDE
ncbi:iron-sulfur cluster assembly protein [Thermococcus sp.]|uniref:iron-sulfur cluster assembly protein n=1 Tax=Thermococcus sp. TaxID=35749 RepID=UPI0025E1F997|nr:iron-sulfur cluster assembly protein [Thermococcus sp.]